MCNAQVTAAMQSSTCWWTSSFEFCKCNPPTAAIGSYNCAGAMQRVYWSVKL